MFIVNPNSGNGTTAVKWTEIENGLHLNDLPYSVSYTKAPMDAVTLTRNAIEDGFDCIAAVGGDGTINEVINGFYSHGKKINENTLFTAIPMGTGCDLARVIDLKKDLKSIIRIWEEGSIVVCDIVEAKYTGWNGQRESRYFINMADIGLGSETVIRVNRNSKVLGGFLSFLTGAVGTIINYKNRYVTVTVDGTSIYSGPSSLVAVANGKYFGGSMMIAPNAEINDGLLDIIVLKDFKKFELICNLPRVYKGAHLNHLNVNSYKGKEVLIESSEEVFLEMDGETTGRADATFRIIPSDMRILV
jgi:YegS/Rv2252/BmrU family lipid kinase